MCSCLSRTPNWGPGPQHMHVTWTGNRTSDPLVYRPMLNPLSYTSQGQDFFLLYFVVYAITVVPTLSHFAHLHPHPPGSPHTVCCSCPWVTHIHSLANPFTFFQPVSPSHLPSNSCQSVPCIHASVSTLFISLFHSLDSTYK